jgi:hypothetical protein
MYSSSSYLICDSFIGLKYTNRRQNSYSNVNQWSVSSSAEWDQLYDSAVDTDPLFLYADRKLVVPAGSTLRVEYTGVAGASNPGFVAQWWKFRTFQQNHLAAYSFRLTFQYCSRCHVYQ